MGSPTVWAPSSTSPPAAPTLPRELPPALPGAFARPPSPEALQPSRATTELVREQVRALLVSSPSFHRLPDRERRRLAHHMVKVAAYAAECVRDDWYQSSRLDQRPLVLREEPVLAQAAQGTGAGFTPGAANEIGSVTRRTLDAIAFPRFVAELIRGTFDAITDASIKQMEAYGRLLGDVGRTVDDFMNQNISDNQAREWLAQTYPSVLRIERAGGSSTPTSRRSGGPARPTRTRTPGSGGSSDATLVPVDGADARTLPNWRADLGVPAAPSLDSSYLEEKLVPAARRKLAQNRLQTLSTIVLMGMNRITVTGGKLRATMAFHIDTSDIAREEAASGVDFATSASGSVGFGPWSASASVSFAYVSSQRSSSESEMNVSADLTSEVEIHFRSDPFPLERMATGPTLGRIASHTAVPEANTPTGSSGAPIPWGGEVQRATVPQRQRAPLLVPPTPTRLAPPPLPPVTPPAQQQPQPSAPTGEATQPPAPTPTPPDTATQTTQPAPESPAHEGGGA